MTRQRVFWQSEFKNSDQPYMIDGAVVRYVPSVAGIYYEHHIIADNICIFEKSEQRFFGLPVGEKVTFTLDAKDAGLFSFLEIRFMKRGVPLWQSFAERNDKSVSFVVPDYDSFRVRVRVRGNGSTQLLSVTARVTSLSGLIMAGDRQLTENLAVEEVDGTADRLLVSYSETLHYLTAEFSTADKPQLHFVTITATISAIDEEKMIEIIKQTGFRQLQAYHLPSSVLQKLAEFATITIIE